jgi:hypothetical protein
MNLKRREAMMLARRIAETALAAVIRQGKGLPSYTLTHAEIEQISATALDVAEYLCVARSE